MRIRTALVGAILASVALTSAARAATYSNNFDSENNGASSLNYSGFTGLTVSTGSVDLVGAPYGIQCAGGSALCVDLDGSTGQGGTLTSGSYAFNAGDHVNFSFDLSGNQRSGAGTSDDSSAGFTFASTTNISNYTVGEAFGTFNVGSFQTTSISTSTTIAADQGFKNYLLSFDADTAGSLTFFLGTTSADNVGPIADNLSFQVGPPTVSAAPEPSTWALMFGGVGLAGLALRRRKEQAGATFAA